MSQKGKYMRAYYAYYVPFVKIAFQPGSANCVQ